MQVTGLQSAKLPRPLTERMFVSDILNIGLALSGMKESHLFHISAIQHIRTVPALFICKVK